MLSDTDERRRVVIVTGAGGTGCGRAIAARFAADGATVVVSDINEAGGEETVRLIERSGGHAAFFRADVRNESQARDLISFAEDTIGGFMVLVNNASAPHGSSDGLEDWMDSIETDLLGAIYATRWAVGAMRRGGGGAIVNIASISALWHGRKTAGGFPGYDVAKAGMHDTDDDEARLFGGEGRHSGELSGAGLDRDRRSAAVLGVADARRASRTQRAFPTADHRSGFGSCGAARRRPGAGRTRSRMVV